MDHSRVSAADDDDDDDDYDNDDDDNDDDDDEVMLNVLKCRLTYQGQAESNAEAWLNISLRPRKPEGSLGRTAQDSHRDCHTAPELWRAAKYDNLHFY